MARPGVAPPVSLQIQPLDVVAAAPEPVDTVLAELESTADGLTGEESRRRLALMGPNAVRTHRARPLAVLLRQFRSPLLLLLLVTAAASFFLGQRADAVIIGVILTASVGLGFLNEFRAERAAEALHEQIQHRVVAVRGGRPRPVDVVDLLPGESVPVEKSADPAEASASLTELTSCALMGTVVSAGTGRGVVVATGGATEFGRIALGLGRRQPETEFQVGLRRFSMLLVKVAGVLTAGVFLVNLLLDRPVVDALLFSLAIAVGISPQLLPAVVSTSLAAGSRRLARAKVLVKRLVCIEDLGDIEVLFTDKTGTLTEGRIEYMRALSPDGTQSDHPAMLGLVCTDSAVDADRVVDGTPLDAALWASPAAPHAVADQYHRVATLPFDHRRRLVSVLAAGPDDGTLLITKGAPEEVLARCRAVPPKATAVLDQEFRAGHRVAVATRAVAGQTTVRLDDERDLVLRGLLVFLHPPKPTARDALRRLSGLGVTVKVIIGDNPVVAARVCTERGLPEGDVLTGSDLDDLTDDRLAARIATTTAFARVSPEQKARIVRAQRGTGVDIAFLGDGVKYVLMGTSSNFGNMFSAQARRRSCRSCRCCRRRSCSTTCSRTPASSRSPTDTVDEEQLRRPSRWDIHLIRRFVLVFGPISSLFDFATFTVMLTVFGAGPALFHPGWFVESLATQTLVLFVIRTRRSPFTRSTPSVPLLAAALVAVIVGAVLPVSPFAHVLGFRPLPAAFLLVLLSMVATYLLLAELGKHWFFRITDEASVLRSRSRGHRIHRRAARFSHLSTPHDDVHTIRRSGRPAHH